MGKRRRARELAIKVLFHMEFSPGDANKAFDLISGSFGSSGSTEAFARRLVLGVCGEKEALDAFIRRSSRNWRLERMSRVDRIILRLGLFEMLHMEDIPPKVSIDEAVELGKIYGIEDSGAFINGILDNIYSNLKVKGAIEK
jgi:transcription antitermination factor NusB